MKKNRQKKAKKELSEDSSPVKLTSFKVPAMLKSREFKMARKRRLSNVSKHIQVGDLLYYCPRGLDEDLRDFGLVLEINNINNYKSSLQLPNQLGLSATQEREFKILWQSDGHIATVSSAYMNHSLISKRILLCNKP